MGVNNSNLQHQIDHVIDKIFLGFIPHTVTPNQVTVVRFILIPIVYWLLSINRFDLGLILFVIAASTDFIDGAMARTRNQITDLGKVIDPIADKLLIMTVLIFIGFNYLIIKIFVFFIVLELLAILFSSLTSPFTGRPVGANVYGKIKMILQSVSVGLFLLGLLVKNDHLIDVSEEILIAALVFAVLSTVEHIRRKVFNLH